MKRLLASLYKDFQLFLRGPGLLTLLLPVLLIPALKLGMGDLSEVSYVRPFPIAVRDLDDTFMSKSLISQIGQIQLFSRIDLLDAATSDADALKAGAAAVVTIPEDFFHKLYRMEECPVDVTLNGDSELESSLFQAIFQSVMDIVRADQAAGMGVYTFVYGDLSAELQREMYIHSGEQLFQDALGRQLIFDTASETADLSGGLLRRLLACTLGLLTLFFALSAVKTLPEELALGVLPRFRTMGGSLWPFLGSKFLTAFLLGLPGALLGAALSPGTEPLFLLFLYVLLLFAAFGLMTAVAVFAGDPQTTQRWGNLFLLISLTLSGTLWPRTVLPGPLPLLGKLTLPYFAALGLEAGSRNMPQILALLWPLPLMGLGGLALAGAGALRRTGGTAPKTGSPAGTALPLAQQLPLAGSFRRLTNLVWFKLRAMAGGLRGLAMILIVTTLCGAAAAAVRTAQVRTLELLICDLDGTVLSQQLMGQLEGAEGVTVTMCDQRTGQSALLAGEAEGLLVIEKGYADALTAGESPSLHYQGAPSARSALGAREIVAGAVSSARSRLRALSEAEELLGRPLTSGEQTRLSQQIQSIESSMPPLFGIATLDGGALTEPFVPSQMGFAALAALLTCLTTAFWCGSGDSRQVRRRMSGIPRGLLLSQLSDYLALTALGMLTLLTVLLPGTQLPLPAMLLYALCTAALSLMLVRFTAQEGRIDTLAPFLALLLCLLGGCFLDLSSLSPGLSALACITPPGAAVQAAAGSSAPMALLALETLGFAAAGFSWRRG